MCNIDTKAHSYGRRCPFGKKHIDGWSDHLIIVFHLIVVFSQIKMRSHTNCQFPVVPETVGEESLFFDNCGSDNRHRVVGDFFNNSFGFVFLGKKHARNQKQYHYC